MGSRQADSEALAARCRAAGWKVTPASGGKGYKVWDPQGKIHPIHLTYSALNSLTRCREGLESAGLIDAEKAIANTRLTENRTRHQVAVEAAEQRGKKMAAASAVSRAAGPYLTDAENLPIDWFTTPHPKPWMRWASITPEIAGKILSDHNGTNRPLDPGTARWYADVILAGLWHLTHQGLAFDTYGQLQDGQHRLQALIEAQKLSAEPIAVPFAVFVGMPPENFKTIDEGRLRTARQLFGKDGEKNTYTLQTCVRLAYYYLDGEARKVSRLRLANQVVIDTFEADADAFREAARYGQARYLKCWSSAGALAAARYLIGKANGRDNTFVLQFFDGLTTGTIPGTRTVLDDDDPRRAYRVRMETRYLKTRDTKGEAAKKLRLLTLTQLGMILTTWNNTVSNRRIRNLYFNDETTIPQILVCKPGEGICPPLFNPRLGAPVEEMADSR